MKLLHLSDLHLGKRVNGFSQIPDQVHVLDQILTLVRAQRPDAVLIAGDIYDKSVPSAEAVELFDRFLTALTQEQTQVLLISGNHDSAERIAFASRLLTHAGVHVSPVYDGTVKCITLRDEYGPVHFWLLPFLKPAHVRVRFPEAAISTYSDAIQTVLEACPIDFTARNVLLSHQLVTGAERSESEDISVGGSENVDVEIFSSFDYVALGHLHRPQEIRPNLRYCGSPLKYSFSEANHNKSVTLIDLFEKGSAFIATNPLTPLHDMKTLRGSYAELMDRSFYLNTGLPDCYLHITLTDEDDIPDAMGRLRSVYPYIMLLDYDNTRTRLQQNPLTGAAQPELGRMELFSLLYEKQNNTPLTQQQLAFLEPIMDKLWEEDL